MTGWFDGSNDSSGGNPSNRSGGLAQVGESSDGPLPAIVSLLESRPPAPLVRHHRDDFERTTVVLVVKRFTKSSAGNCSSSSAA